VGATLAIASRRCGLVTERFVIRGVNQIRDAYRDQDVAARYVDTRFREPLGALLHDRQVAYLTRLFTSVKPTRVLEIAPGPARLTRDVIAPLVGGPVLLDASAQMLAEAKRRLASDAERCDFVQGDAFTLPFRSCFDVVYTFRLIRHFERDDRVRLYKAIGPLLTPGGVLVFDAVNQVVSEPLRRASPEAYQHYDGLVTPESLVEELREADMRLVSLVDVQRRYAILAWLQVIVAPRSRLLARATMEFVDRFGGGRPLEWIVTCRRA